MRRTVTSVALVFGVLGLAALAARPLEWKFDLQPIRAQEVRVALEESQAQAQTAEEGLENLRSQSRAFVQIAKTILPSVVSINSTRNVTPASDRQSPQFFGDQFLDRFFDGPARPFPFRGSGSGVIVDGRGYILTNNHVVANADEIEVVTEDGRTLRAELVGRDEKSDVAVIRVEATDLHAARLGNSDNLEVGEWVLAAGNPFQLSSTVTAGIVSAVGRSDIGLTDYENFIQTDAAINPGNSGGALVDLDGNVVGINTAIATRTGGYQGVGFAIPINMAKQIMDSLIENGRVVRGWLGVNIQDMNEAMAEYHGLDKPQGALVGGSMDGSPAEKAGILQGDVILALNGTPVKNVKDLRLRVTAIEPGTRIELTVLRDGSRRTMPLVLGELESETAEGEPTSRSPSARGSDRASDLGLTLEGLTLQTRRELDLDPETRGVVVSDVDPVGAAASAGFRPGDVILEVGDQQINAVGDVEAALARFSGGQAAMFLVLRGGTEVFLGMRLPK